MKKIILLTLLAVCFAGCCKKEKPAELNLAVASTENCRATTPAEISGLFDKWNSSLSVNAKAVVSNYADKSILLPTASAKIRITADEKEDYFNTFLLKKPKGVINFSQIEIGCNTAVDSGLYTFTYSAHSPPDKVQARYTFTYKWDEKRKLWLITNHHSSIIPPEP